MSRKMFALELGLCYLGRMDELLTTSQAAERLGVTPGRVRQMVADGILPVTRIGRDNLVKVADLKLVEDRKPGRPPKKTGMPASKKSGKK